MIVLFFARLGGSNVEIVQLVSLSVPLRRSRIWTDVQDAEPRL